MSETMKYPKIDTIWKRDADNYYIIIDGEYTRPEFKLPIRWEVSEKIDGMNIRVHWEDGIVFFGGRTDRAEIPKPLGTYLESTFTPEAMRARFGDADAVLFGEGYGEKIQKGGGLYRSGVGFVMFDAYVDGWWLRRDAINMLALQIGIPSVDVIGLMTSDEIVDYVKSAPQSILSQHEKVIEGIVARVPEMMLFRNGTPIMWKLKVKDYR